MLDRALFGSKLSSDVNTIKSFVISLLPIGAVYKYFIVHKATSAENSLEAAVQMAAELI